MPEKYSDTSEKQNKDTVKLQELAINGTKEAK